MQPWELAVLVALEALAYLGHGAIRWPLAVALGGVLVDAGADWRFWRRHGGTFVSTPGFTAMARWLTLNLGIQLLATQASREERAALG